MSSFGNLLIPRPGMPYEGGQFNDFKGGLNDALSDELIEQNELSAIQNYIPDPENSGVLTKREGISQISSQQAAAFIGQIHDGIHDIWAMLPTDVIDDTGTAQGLTLTSSTDCDWASFAGYDIVTNGTELRKCATGPTWTALGGSPPAFKYLSVYNRFLFGAGHDKAKVRWCNPDDPETWDADNEWNLAPDAADNIVGLARFRDVLVVMGQRSFWHLRGFDEKAIQITYRGEPGCVSHRTIVPTPYGLFWWSYDGIYWSPDGYQAFNISELKIPKTIDGLNSSKFGLNHAVWNMNRQRVEFYTFSSGSTTQDTAIFYYPRIGIRDIYGVPVGSFWIQKGGLAAMAASGDVTVSGEKRVYLGSASATGYVYNETGGTDDGAAISAFYETKRDSTAHGPASIKRTKTFIPGFELTGDANVTFGVYFNNSQSIDKSWSLSLSASSGFVLGVDALDVGVLGSGAVGEDTPLHWSQKFRKFKFRVADEAGVTTKYRGIRTEGYLVNL